MTNGKLRDQERKDREEKERHEKEKAKALERETEVKRQDALEKARIDAEIKCNGGNQGLEDDEDIGLFLSQQVDHHELKELTNVSDDADEGVSVTDKVGTGGDQASISQSEVSKIFGKGASDLRFEPGKSSTPTRDDFKRNNSVGSTGSLDSDKDSSKKLRLDLSPSSNSPEAADEMAEDSGGSKPLPNLPDDDISEIKIVSGD